mmetsp:Transcript_23016/g.38954  ORF Transcript_23016/g.38954 Transcript_23016/m.38954 type:complete len:679 (+) Transcript_23016:1388-3424(+)
MGVTHIQNLGAHIIGKGGADLFGGDPRWHAQKQRQFLVGDGRAGRLAGDQIKGCLIDGDLKAHFAEQRMVSAARSKDLAQEVNQVARQRLKVACQFQFTEQAQKIEFGGQHFGRDIHARRGEEQVFSNRQGGVVAAGIEAMYKAVQISIRQRLGHLGAQRDEGRAQLRMRLGVALLVHRAPGQRRAAAHAFDQFGPPGTQVVRACDSGDGRVEPLGLKHVGGIACAYGLSREIGRVRAVHRCKTHGHQHVVAKGALKHNGARGCMTDPLGNHRLMQGFDVMARHRDRAAGGQGFTGQHFGKRTAVLVIGGGNADHGPGRQGDRNVFKHRIAVAVAHRHLIQHNLAGQMRHIVDGAIDQRVIDHPIGGKTLGNRLPTQGHIGGLVVIGQQLFPRGREVFVGGKGCDQRANGHLALDHQIAADGEKEERGQLGDEVVDELHEKLFLVNLEADIEEAAQPVPDHRHPVAPAAVDPQSRSARRPFANLGGQGADLNDAFLVQLVDLFLQAWDQPRLKRDQGTGGQAKGHRLEKEEAQDRQHLARLQHRLRHGVAHEPTHRLAFGGDHADQLALAGAFEIGLGKAQDARNQRIAEAAQKPFGQHAFHRVDAHFHDAMQQHRHQKRATEQQQILHLTDFKPIDVNGGRAGADGVVDDPFGQFQCQIQQRKQRHRDQQQNQLVPL